jgi:GT2 family glycosyltransferase
MDGVLMSNANKFALIILNWNGKKDTLACLASLEKLTYPNYFVILVDNGSTDGTLESVHEAFPQVQTLALPSNLGFAGGNNPGIEMALKQNADIIVLLNNDTVVASDLLECFARRFEQEKEVGILGAKIYLFDAQDTLDHYGGVWIKEKADVNLIGYREKADLESKVPSIDYACGACIAIKRCVFQTIGLLEARYFLYWEENDFCLRAKKAKFLTQICPEAKIWHKVSASVVGGKPHATYFWWRGRLLWIARHYTFLEKVPIYFTILLPAFFKMIKIGALKRVQLALLRMFFPKEDQKKRIEKLQKNRAALAGIYDYYRKRFDQGPSWIYVKK